MDDVVWIHYIDGSKLGVKITPPLYIINVTCDGQKSTYSDNDVTPELVRHRISNDLKLAMEHLKMTRSV